MVNLDFCGQGFTSQVARLRSGVGVLMGVGCCDGEWRQGEGWGGGVRQERVVVMAVWGG